MFINHWKKDILTIPNLLSLLRLGLIPIYIVIYLDASRPSDYFLAGSILAFSCLTDAADGYIARRFHMISNFGKLLDPLADKLTQLTLMLTLSLRHPVMRFVVLFFLMKESFQVVTSFLFFRKGKALPGAILPGKISTSVLFFSFILLVLIPEMKSPTLCVIAAMDAFFLCYAFISYVFAFFGPDSMVQDWAS